jgi:hypothetical protein
MYIGMYMGMYIGDLRLFPQGLGTVLVLLCVCFIVACNVDYPIVFLLALHACLKEPVFKLIMSVSINKSLVR